MPVAELSAAIVFQIRRKKFLNLNQFFRILNYRYCSYCLIIIVIIIEQYKKFKKI